MDITYLLWLQEIREKAGPVVENIFSTLTDIPSSPITILLLAAIYWCVEKRIGFFLLFSQSGGNFINNIIKNCVCVYRPWIRDSRIMPPQKALESATGYSFPSGHSQNVMGEYGALGYQLFKKDRKQKKHTWAWAVVVCLLIVVLVAFSRNFLSVHTPQDVIVGLTVGLIFICLTNLLLSWEAHGAEKGKKNRDLLIVVTGTIIVVAASLFIRLKPYPLDFVDGNLAVDPYKMQSDYFSAAASFLALLWGWFIEKRWVKFDTECPVWQKILRIVFGTAGVCIIYYGFSALIKPHIPSYHVYCMIKNALPYFFVVGLYPAIFTAVERKIKKGRKAQKKN